MSLEIKSLPSNWEQIDTGSDTKSPTYEYIHGAGRIEVQISHLADDEYLTIFWYYHNSIAELETTGREETLSEVHEHITQISEADSPEHYISKEIRDEPI